MSDLDYNRIFGAEGGSAGLSSLRLLGGRIST